MLTKTTSLLLPALFHFPEMRQLLTLLHESRNILQQMLIVRISQGLRHFLGTASTTSSSTSSHPQNLPPEVSTASHQPGYLPPLHASIISYRPQYSRIISAIFFSYNLAHITDYTIHPCINTHFHIIPSTIFHCESAMIIGIHRYIILVTYLLRSNNYLMFMNLTFAERTINLASVTVRYYS
jgi:hypothetical protein